MLNMRRSLIARRGHFFGCVRALRDCARPSNAPGLGLHNMRERADAIGGEVNIASEPEAGTSVVVEVPVADG